MDISAVIPTRNREKSLYRALQSLSVQHYKLREVIIIDSSDEPLSAESLLAHFPNLNIIYQISTPAASIQRNKGIQLATSSHIFLCPDDLEVPENYLPTLEKFFEIHPEVSAATGFCFEPDTSGQLHYIFPTIKFRNLLWNFLFQLTVWADVAKTQTNIVGNLILIFLQRHYRSKGNTYTLAGWPLVTQIDGSHFRTSLFSLGGSVIRRDWLLQSPYDEILDAHGIGDNYGVTLNFPEEKAVWVNTETYVIHHKSHENRLSKPLTYFRRILALHYFMKQSHRFSKLNRLFLVWSLFGNFIYQSLKKQTEMRRATTKAILLISTGNNPYVIGSRNGNIRVTPEL